MRGNRLRAGAVALLLVPSACTRPMHAPQPVTPIAGMAAGCRAAANGGPEIGAPDIDSRVADRGIGGTGAPAAGAAPPARGVERADRGIGGTGIIGVITGFASICLGGQEVGYGPAVPILVDGRPAMPADLRAGQLALVDATGPDAALQARTVAIRHEVTGPVQSSFADGAERRMLRVAGQRVVSAEATLGDRAPPVGAWVAVSGFRDPDGLIHATRIDPNGPGEARIAGPLLSEGGHLRIGTAEIVPAAGLVLSPGRDVVVSGRWSDGMLRAVTSDPDPLPDQPAALFGPGVTTLVIESYAGLSDGRLVLGRLQRRMDGQPIRRSVVELARGAGGALRPVIHEMGPSVGGFERVGAPPPGLGRPGLDRSDLNQPGLNRSGAALPEGRRLQDGGVGGSGAGFSPGLMGGGGFGGRSNGGGRGH